MEMRKYIVTIDCEGTVKAVEYEEPREHCYHERDIEYDQWERFLYCLAGDLLMKTRYRPHCENDASWQRGYRAALNDFKVRLMAAWKDIF